MVFYGRSMLVIIRTLVDVVFADKLPNEKKLSGVYDAVRLEDDEERWAGWRNFRRGIGADLRDLSRAGAGAVVQSHAVVTTTCVRFQRQFLECGWYHLQQYTVVRRTERTTTTESLLQRDQVSWVLVNCCTTIRKITYETGSSKLNLAIVRSRPIVPTPLSPTPLIFNDNAALLHRKRNCAYLK